MIKIPVSLGELYDKIAILRLKKEFIKDPDKLLNIEKELKNLLHIAYQNKIELFYEEELEAINRKIWIVEEQVRVCEKYQWFDAKFIEIARSVYLLNDERSSIKSRINKEYNSELIEEKSHD